MSMWDHLFAFTVFVAFPAYAWLSIRSTLVRIRELGEPARVSDYLQTIVAFSAFAVWLLIMWASGGREWSDLGISAGEIGPQLIAFAIALAALALFILPIRSVAKDPARHDEIKGQMGEFSLLMPRSPREVKWFTGVSINAGVTEELIFRGYLIWYLEHFVSLYWAAAIALALFALAHLYQGLKQLPGIVLVSLVPLALYLYTGSLLVPILFHMTVDMLQGRYLARIYH